MSTEDSVDIDVPNPCADPVNITDTGDQSINGGALSAEGANEDAATSEQPRSIAKTKLCGVCNEKVSKYKCTRCFIPYCSVTCSRVHRATHPAIDTTPASTPETIPTSNSYTIQPKALAGTVGFCDPFAALEDSTKLQELFKRYPCLPSQLDGIHAATLEPLDNFREDGYTQYNSRGGGRGGQRSGKEPWNRDRGIQNGLQALSRARTASGKDGEGVREFSKLVLQIVSGDEGMSAVELVEKEKAEEDMRIISQLLNRES